MTDEVKMRKFTTRQRVFVDEYLKCFNASEAARRAGYTGAADVVGPRLLGDVGIRTEIDKRLSEIHMSADEALQVIEQQARANIGEFFKLVEEWTFFPLPTYDVLGAKEVTDDTNPDNPKIRVSYWVRHVVLDVDKLVDPKYSHLIRDFSDSPKNGLSIKLHDKQQAARDILKMHGRFTEKIDLTTGGEKIKTYIGFSPDDWDKTNEP
jgi:hypothetical protein